ncbi:hypothetical protein EPUS_01465 [Endocarpon pusillum Z07020]|uniref:Trafficking protein particle complex II-specific subunit 65 IgD3 domain-containing protein n=1 Tax=Endocarpon pusillum (strain Z07020 / HMAS-L-300199) TaxID=1263415 RepID=U1GVP5_ENDPU|nr:uncharacterized protein EPUS_01465 [Endocarpon pusillum Z07020]ERF76131.1 hypothetical protein EPUS_01465 [Endocarpon pusillum Z07020]
MAALQRVRAFFRDAMLDTIVPEVSQPILPEVLESTSEAATEDESSLIPIKQRRHLYFDERLTVYVVLRIVNGAEEALKEYLPRLDIRLDVHAIGNFSSQSNQSNQADSGGYRGSEKDLVFSGHIHNDRDPFIVVNADEEPSNHNQSTILAIWATEAVLNRPRFRLPNATVTFTASVKLRPAKHADGSPIDDEYLPPLVPAPTNILERLKTIPALEDRAPYLPASRIESVLPGPQIDSEALHIRHQPTKRITISPAVSARIRCSRMATNFPHPTTIASLDFEVTPFATFDVLLDRANVSLASDGKIEAISPLPMPIRCRPRSTVTFLYKVQPPAHPAETPLPLPTTAPNTVGFLDILLESTLQISEKCKPTITMRWRSNVDLSVPPNARLGPSYPRLPLHPPAPLQASRPTSLTTTTTTTTTKPPPFSGLTISFTFPPTAMLGQSFPLTLLLTNHTAHPLKLAIIPIPRRPASSSTHHSSRKHAPKPSASSALDRRHHTTSFKTLNNAHPHPPVDMAPAVLDENIIHALQKSSINAHTDTDLIPISTDVRVGPLGSGACHEVQLKLVALRVGVLRLEAVRVVDLGREQEGGVGSGVVDVRGDELPEVLVVDGRVALGMGEKGGMGSS